MRPLCILAAALALTFAPAAGAAETATVSEASTLHAGPAARFPAIGTIERNQQVRVKGCSKSGRWCEIDSNGRQGWIYAPHLTPGKAPSEPAQKERSAPSATADTNMKVDMPNMKVDMPAAPPATVETEKGGGPGKPVIIIIKSADGKVSSTMTVAAGSNVVVTASGRSRCELKAAVNP